MLNTITKHNYTFTFLITLFFCMNTFSQKEIFFDDEKYEEKDKTIIEGEKIEKEKVEVYSIFNDFRIPIRENINASDLRYYGWVTEANKYTYRCRNGKRIRLTYWYLNKGPESVLDSEFINITPAMDECQKGDIEFSR